MKIVSALNIWKVTSASIFWTSIISISTWLSNFKLISLIIIVVFIIHSLLPLVVMILHLMLAALRLMLLARITNTTCFIIPIFLFVWWRSKTFFNINILFKLLLTLSRSFSLYRRIIVKPFLVLIVFCTVWSAFSIWFRLRVQTCFFFWFSIFVIGFLIRICRILFSVGWFVLLGLFGSFGWLVPRVWGI